jgi:nitroreductase
MDVFECIKTRPAVRSFRPDPIPPEMVKKILQAGPQAHSRRHRQPWHFIVIENKETLRQIGALAAWGEGIGSCWVLQIEGSKNGGSVPLN